MDVAIAVSGSTPEAQALAVRLIERGLRHLDYPVTVLGEVANPSSAEMVDWVADARAAGIRFDLVACR